MRRAPACANRSLVPPSAVVALVRVAGAARASMATTWLARSRSRPRPHRGDADRSVQPSPDRRGQSSRGRAVGAAARPTGHRLLGTHDDRPARVKARHAPAARRRPERPSLLVRARRSAASKRSFGGMVSAFASPRRRARGRAFHRGRGRRACARSGRWAPCRARSGRSSRRCAPA